VSAAAATRISVNLLPVYPGFRLRSTPG